MAHQRKSIRDEIAAALVGKTDAGDRVYANRVLPHRKLRLPAISIYTLSESATDNLSAPREYQRKMVLAVEAAVSSLDDVDDTVDVLAEQIEIAMDAEPTFGGVCSDCKMTGTEVEVLMDGDRPVGALRISYEVTYYTYAPDAANVTLDDLETVVIDTQVGTSIVEDVVTFGD
jgi:hypothetical protein